MNRPAGFTVGAGMQKPPKWVIEEATRAGRKAWCAKDSRGVVAWIPGGHLFTLGGERPAPAVQVRRAA